LTIVGSLDLKVGESYARAKLLASDLALSALEDGAWVIVWSSDEKEDAFGTRIYAQVLNADGTARGEQISVGKAEDWSTPLGVEATADGGFVVTWNAVSKGTESWPDKLYLRRYDASGAPLDSKNLIASSELDEDSNGQIAGSLFDPTRTTALPDGRLVVTFTDWTDEQYNVFQQLYAANGAKIGVATRVNTFTAQNQMHPDTILLDDGGWLTAWSSNGQESADDDWGVYFQRFDSAGGKVGSEAHVNTIVEGSQYLMSLAKLETGGWVIAWDTYSATSGRSSNAQIFAADGQRVGGEISFPDMVDPRRSPEITALDGGGFVATWLAGRNVYQQGFQADGTEFVEAGVVNEVTAFEHEDPQVLAFDGGGWIVFWEDTPEYDDHAPGWYYRGSASKDGSGSGIYYQVFNPDGTRDGGEVRVNLQTEGSQEDFEVAALDDGRWVVTWFTKPAHFGDPEIIRQRIFSLGDNAAPSDISLSGHKAVEAAAAGTKVGTFTATDADNAAFNWELLDDADGRFEIDSETGVLRVAHDPLLE
jgi:hypothetical protein